MCGSVVVVSRWPLSLALLSVLLSAAACDGPEKGLRQYVDSGGPRAESCATTTCHRDAQCTDTEDGPVCACNTGFNGDGFQCTDIDECDANTDNCDTHATCVNTAGSFTCTCDAPAWQGNGTTCSDADECEDNTDNCSANATCINTVGSFNCECSLGGDAGMGDDNDAGVESTDAGMSTMDAGAGNMMCRDIDECATNTDDCDPNATCINNNEGFICQCNPGYTAVGNSAGHGVNGCSFAYCDLTGRWAVKTKLVVSWDDVRFNGGAVVVCGATDVPSYSWELREFAYDGETLTMKSKGCGSTESIGHNPDGQKFAQYVPYSMFDAIDLTQQAPRAIPWAPTNAQPTGPFVTPFEAVTFGMRLADPGNPDAWPSVSGPTTDSPMALSLPPTRFCSTNDPPCWEDDDHDPVAAPGYTTWSRTPSDAPAAFYTLPTAGVRFNPPPALGACYKLGSRSISRFNGAHESCDRVTGDVDVMLKSNGEPALEAWVQGCKLVPDQNTSFDCYDPTSWNSMSDCTSTDVRTLNNQSLRRTIESATFEMVRIADNAECPDVRTMFPAPEPTREYCNCDANEGCN